MEKLVIIGGARSNFVWAVRAFAEERAVPYDHVPEMPHQGERLEGAHGDLRVQVRSSSSAASWGTQRLRGHPRPRACSILPNKGEGSKDGGQD